jgi:hypothetical protein
MTLPVAAPRAVNDVLRSASRAYNCAVYGYEVLANAGIDEERCAGMVTAIVFGRAVLPNLDALSGIVDDYEDWAGPVLAVHDVDPLTRFFADLPEDALHNGTILDTKTTIAWNVSLSPDDGPMTVDPADPGPDAVITFNFLNPPKQHLGDKLDTNDVAELVAIYLGWIRQDVLDPVLAQFAEGEWGEAIRAGD